MKKTALLTLLLALILALTACDSSAISYDKVNVDKYVTLGEYKGLTYTPTDTTVSDYELTVALNTKLSDSGYAVHKDDVNLTEGTVQIGDNLDINFKGLKDGVAFEGGTAENYELKIGSGAFIEGFEEGLVGAKVGETVKLNLTFPENYSSAELAGQAVIFEVKINSIKDRVEYSELTDTLANTLNKETATAEEFKTALKNDLAEEKKAEGETEVKNQLWSKTLQNVTFAKKLPKKLVEKAGQKFIDHYTALATQYGYDNLDGFLTANKITKKNFNAQAEQQGTSIVQRQLAAYAIAKKEGYTVSNEDLQNSAKMYADKYGYTSAEKYIAAVGKDAVRDQAVLDYAINIVLENAVEKA
jgi:trigger factor